MGEENKDESTDAALKRSRSDVRKPRGRRRQKHPEEQDASDLTAAVGSGDDSEHISSSHEQDRKSGAPGETHQEGRQEPRVARSRRSSKKSGENRSGDQDTRRRSRLRNSDKGQKQPEDAASQQSSGARLKGGNSEAGIWRLLSHRAKALSSSLIAAGLVLAAVVIVVNARMAPLPHKNYTVNPAAVPARDATKVCPAPPRLLDTATGIDPKFSPVSRDTKTQVRAFTASRVADRTPEVSLKERGGNGLVQGDISEEAGQKPYLVLQTNREVTAGSEVEAKSVGDRQVEVASAFSYAANDGDMQGLTVAGCQTPRNELWISGIATSLGYTSILTITNPGQSNAPVNITLYDEQGMINSAAAQLVVEAQSERSVMLAALGRSKDRLTAKISSSASAVTATVSQNKMRGLSPGGVEILTPGEEPSSQQIIPAYRQADPQQIKELSSQLGYQDATPSLQITAPDEDARVRVHIYSEQGEYKLEEQEFDVQAQTVRDISLEGLPEGMYTLQITSTNSNIIAAARMISGKRGQNVDFAWAHGTKAVAAHHIFAISGFGATTVSVFSPGSQGKLQLTPIAASGLAKGDKTLEVADNKVITLKPEDYGEDIIGFMVGKVDGTLFVGQSVTVDSKNQISWLDVPRPIEEQSGVPVVLQY